MRLGKFLQEFSKGNHPNATSVEQLAMLKSESDLWKWNYFHTFYKVLLGTPNCLHGRFATLGERGVGEGAGGRYWGVLLLEGLLHILKHNF